MAGGFCLNIRITSCIIESPLRGIHHPIERAFAVHAEVSASTGTILILNEGGHPGNYIAVIEESRTARITEAASARDCIVRKQHRIVTNDAVVDLDQINGCIHTNLCGFNFAFNRACILITITHNSELLTALVGLEGIQLVK
ncbi:hypothetical protein ACHAW5_001252 [Stephanodiscus triporus]|uniref:Uncharacterized protein n=1 Tax=Stephanodiscus triporus TaxID=2934178 RepID=A0ABD3N052_9STRA